MGGARLCKDCKHVRLGRLAHLVWGYRFAKCGGIVHLVTGKADHYCYPLRRNEEWCGREGIYWEEKKRCTARRPGFVIAPALLMYHQAIKIVQV